MVTKTSRTAWRIAVVVSLIWISGAYFLSEESERFRWFLLLGVLPVLIGWAVRWVVLSHRDELQRKNRPGRFRFLRRR